MKYSLIEQSVEEVILTKERTLRFKEDGYSPFFKFEVFQEEEIWERIESLSDDWEIKFIDRKRVILANDKESKIRFIIESEETKNSGVARITKLRIDDRTFEVSDLENRPLFESIRDCSAFSWVANRIASLTKAR